MNRPLKRKLTLALLAYLDSRKSGLAYADITLVTGAGTTLAQETAFDADATETGEIAEPLPPYLAVEVLCQADPDLPGVVSFEAVLHVKTLATVENEEGEPSSRFDADAILRDAHNVLMTPTNDAAAFSDSNRECAAFCSYASKPGGSDTRPTFRKPLHVYDMWHTSSPSLFDGDAWHDQLVFAGVAQDMDNA